MARTVRDASLDTRSARLRLVEGKKHWRSVEKTLHIGYRRGPRGGVWYARRFADGQYIETTLGVADDTTDADGAKVITYRQSIEEARRWWQAAERSVLGVPDDDAGPYTVDRACDDYLAHYRAKGGKAEYSVKRTIDVHIRPSLGAREVDKLKTRELRNWHHALAQAPKMVRTKSVAEKRATRQIDQSDAEAVRSRRATANRILTVLKAVLNHAWRERDGTSDAEWRPVKPFARADAPVVRYLSPAESLRLINTCPADLRRLVKAAVLTGARYGELAKLKVGDVDLSAGSIAIRESKSGKPRHVVLTDEGRGAFAEFILGKASSDLVLTHDDGTPWKASQQTRPLAEACIRAKIEPAIGFHVLRHSHASALAMAGVPMAVIAQQLGHADTRITERHYAHMSPSFVAETIRASFPTIGISLATNVREFKKA